MSKSDSELLQSYVAESAEPAFAELVRRHIDLVYSAALRQADGDRHLAEDVTQNVFADLARKAARLQTHPLLVGWLYTSTRYSARTARRSDRRRQLREQQAFTMNQLLQPDPAVNWEHLRPLLDDAMNSLNEGDRRAVLLRFFNRLPLAEVGAHLAVSENTARMRVERAVDKLRSHLAKMGFTSTAAILAILLTNYAVEGAPVGLAVTVTSAAVATGATAAAGGLAALLGLKVLLAGTAVVVILAAVPVVRHYYARASSPATSAGPVTAGNGAPDLPTGASPRVAAPTAARAAIVAANSGPVLTLHIVKGPKNSPLAGVQVDYRGWSEGRVDHHTVTVGDEGTVMIYYPATTTNLVLITEKDGYADTRLAWSPGRGAAIPDSYIVRPDPAIPISGRIVDEQGRPVAGVVISWSTRGNYGADAGLTPESHAAEAIPAATDASGHWHLERIADDLLHRLEGDITNANYGPVFLTSDQDPELAQEEQELRNGSLVTVLKSTLVIRGRVTDAAGLPVSGATVLVGRLLQAGRRETTTLADGSFSVEGCAPGPSPVTAQADGFAPAATQIIISNGTPPVRLTLQPARPLYLRVVRPDGTPIPDASLVYNWSDYDGPPAVAGHPDRSIVQARFRENAGPDGRLTWSNAPGGEVMFIVSAPGFIQIRDGSARADGVEHLITLKPGTTVSGAVRDATTGAVIPNFRITLGYPDREPALVSNRMGWVTNFTWVNNRAQDFDGGAYRQALDRPLVLGEPNPQYALRFEAGGYGPFVSRIFNEGEGDTQLDVTLRQSPEVVVTVLKPDGRLAVGVDVGFVSSGAGLKLAQGGFLPDPLTTALRRTGVDGRFRLPGDPGVTRIIIAGNDGFLSATPESLRAAGTAQLEPWGILEGICLVDGKPVAGQQYKLALPEETLAGVMCDLEAFKVETDVRGRFTIQRAPPGSNYLERVTTGVGPNGPITSIGAAGQIPVTVRPGETNIITLQP